MSEVKFVNISRLITAYNLQIDNEALPNDLKCVKCKFVLQDACEVYCGCRFCRVCIDDLTASGSEFCPGVSEDCGESILSRFLTDKTANESICKLIVKCPQNGCFHKCQLDELEEHMRVCGRKSVACPFHELGCQQDILAPDGMSGYFHQENRSYFEILTGMINDINREMESHKREIESHKIEIEMLKRSEESKNSEIELLKCELVLKDEKLNPILDQLGHVENEIKSMKRVKADIVDRMRNLSEKIEREIEARRESNEQDMANVIEQVVIEMTAITAQIESNKDELDTAIRSVRDDIQSINEDSIKSIKDDIDWIKFNQQSIQAPEVGLGQIDASFEWTIDRDISKKDSNWWEWTKTSGFFTGWLYPYKYRLESGKEIKHGEICIYLCIYSGASDALLSWPFLGRVAITVADKINCNVSKAITQQCKIRRPAVDRYIASIPFRFSHFSLIETGLDLAHGLRVSCMIVPSSSTC